MKLIIEEVVCPEVGLSKAHDPYFQMRLEGVTGGKFDGRCCSCASQGRISRARAKITAEHKLTGEQLRKLTHCQSCSKELWNGQPMPLNDDVEHPPAGMMCESCGMEWLAGQG